MATDTFPVVKGKDKELDDALSSLLASSDSTDSQYLVVRISEIEPGTLDVRAFARGMSEPQVRGFWKEALAELSDSL